MLKLHNTVRKRNKIGGRKESAISKNWGKKKLMS